MSTISPQHPTILHYKNLSDKSGRSLLKLIIFLQLLKVFPRIPESQCKYIFLTTPSPSYLMLMRMASAGM